MCLPLVTWSSEALATQRANSKKMQAVVLIISRRFQVSLSMVGMFSEVEIEIYKVFEEESWRRFFVCFSFFFDEVILPELIYF